MTTQIAVKLPDELVSRVDDLVSKGAFRNRSAAVRDGLEAVVRAKAREGLDQQYARAFALVPESDDELAHATQLAIQSIAEEPWDRWW